MTDRLARHNAEVAVLTQEHFKNIAAVREMFAGRSDWELHIAIQEEHAKFAKAATALTDRHRAEVEPTDDERSSFSSQKE